ncbi:hypothetical protein JCM11251_002462 [Rhodosporidiobolus azoricus]
MPRGVSDVYDPLVTRSSQRTNNLQPHDQPRRQNTLDRSNTATSISTFFFGGRRTGSSPPARRAAGVPDPPPNYEHVDDPSAQSRFTGNYTRIAALRASKLVNVDKMSSADRLTNWMERTDPEMSRMEKWRRRVEEELRKEREERELVAAAEAEVLAAEADKALPKLPKSAFSNSNEDSDGHGGSGGGAFGLTRSDSTVTGETVMSAVVVATAEVVPSAKARSIHRSTVAGSGVPASVEASPPPPPQPVPPASYQFPVGAATASCPEPLHTIDTGGSSAHVAGSSSLSSAQPRPGHGTLPPRTSSLPFNNLAKVPVPPPQCSAPPPQCSFLPPKAAALLGLIPSASAPLDLRPAAAPLSLPSVVSASPLAIHILPRPPFFAYDSVGGGDSARKDSLDTASVSASTRTGGSFWSHNTAQNGYAGLTSALTGRPSFESSSAPTTASPQQTQPYLLPSTKAGRPFPLGVGSSFSAALAHSQSRGGSVRRKAPPCRLHLRKEGMSSSPDLTTPLKERSPKSVLPFSTYAQAQLNKRHAAVAADDDEEATESLMDVPFYGNDFSSRGRPGFGDQITTVSLGAARGGAAYPPPRSDSLSRDGGGVVGTLVRSLSKAGGSNGYLSRKLSKMSLRSDGGEVGTSMGAGSGIRTLGRKLSLRRADHATPSTRAAAVHFAPTPSSLVQKKTRRRTKDEWEMDSLELARRMQRSRPP